MTISIQYVFKGCIVGALLLGILSCSQERDISFSDKVKVALREVGHQLLLANKDSTTVVKPVTTVDASEYQLSFENQLGIYPDSLVATIKDSFKKTGVGENYLIEVLECTDQEVSYSYYNKEHELGTTNIHCSNRQLKKGCYRIHITFVKSATANTGSLGTSYALFLGIVIFIAVAITYLKVTSKATHKDDNEVYMAIGKFQFYAEQNKLVKEDSEIRLSTKECELLSIFVAKPNHVIKRDELRKKVWEDNGVVVGRSLDTYISKLRKKLQEDPAIKLTNIHGVGYRLEL